jgi:hypothetical protein
MLAFLLSAAVMNAGVLLGARYGVLSQSATYSGVKTNQKSMPGPGFMLGYDADSYRIIAVYDMFDGKDKSEANIASLGLHLIEQRDAEIRAFLGFDLGQLSYRHSSPLHTKSDNFGVYGVSVGIVLLDERFPGAQLELGGQYMRTSNGKNENLDLDDVFQYYVRLNFDLW